MGRRVWQLYQCLDGKGNKEGVILKKFAKNVLEEKRIRWDDEYKLEVEGAMLNAVSGFAPQIGCELKEKNKFWRQMEEVIQGVPRGDSGDWGWLPHCNLKDISDPV